MASVDSAPGQLRPKATRAVAGGGVNGGRCTSRCNSLADVQRVCFLPLPLALLLLLLLLWRLGGTTATLMGLVQDLLGIVFCLAAALLRLVNWLPAARS